MAKLNIQPAPGYTLIEPEETKKQTKSGIYLPESHEGEKPQMGTVLAVGADLVQDATHKMVSPCKVGQTIIYKKWGGNEFKHQDKELILVKFDDILAVIGN